MPDHRGQFVLMQTPGALPGKCAGCGKAKSPEGFIDTGFDSDFWGVVYYCYECVADMASKFGFITPDVAESFKNRISELEKESVNQRAAILGLEDTVDGLLQVRSSGVSSITVPAQPESVITPDPEEQVTPEEPITLRDFVVETTEPNIEPGNTEVDDNPIEQGSVGVPDDNGLADWDELNV